MAENRYEEAAALPDSLRPHAFEYCLRLGDTALVLGHRLSEWCAMGPTLEEDIALSNIALDQIGHAQNFLKLAGEVEGQGRDENDLAYLRDEIDFRNVLLVETENGDFAKTLARQFLIDTYNVLLYEKLSASTFKPLAAVAEKALKEVKYHYRRSSEWVIRLGDGTEESHRRMQEGIDSLWTFTEELFEVDPVEEALADAGIVSLRSALKGEWRKHVESVLKEATLAVPSNEQYMTRGGFEGVHTEHLGHLLSRMQIIRRSYPDAQWG